jgi:hypothetical protein
MHLVIFELSIFSKGLIALPTIKTIKTGAKLPVFIVYPLFYESKTSQ